MANLVFEFLVLFYFEFSIVHVYLILEYMLEILALIIPLLVLVAFLTLTERKFLAGIMKRRGPNVVGVWGLLQPFADGLKLVLKENIFVLSANRSLYILAPVLVFFFAIMNWAVIPFADRSVLTDINLGILYLFILSSLSVWGVIMAGWSSNSRYAFLGCLRSAAQMISYEVSIGIILISVALCVGSLNISAIVDFQEDVWLVFPCFPFFILFVISALAETNRPPFDLPEAEAELVSGYNVEYASTGFALFFLGEYANIILMSTFVVCLFLGGWHAPFQFAFDFFQCRFLLYLVPGTMWFAFKVMLMLFFFIWVRATFPRYRYDQLMRLGWKVFVPLSLGWMILAAGVMVLFGYL